ncbi:transcription termination factor NusA [Gloeomargarita lithophora Alchichica-D10]|uniref:Transcription termination/antitermination protein NusA n=1 Tax=Gloeomargarita lithophora Alchichica-D10 TaxID=1188229 RepID=A0A1J0AEN9_9CYAN|nr:transcription termination factor NusA [Gloeomargarita lithophora]APB34404.1 transcription termination factor NusA [Gloeomargarita lithophora Alchichica-D10]
MSIINLPNLKELIDEISRTHNLPKPDLHEALREALLKGYEKHRRAREFSNPNFTEEYFQNFDVELDLAEGGFRVLAEKMIVTDVQDPDHEVALQEVQPFIPEAQLGGTVVLDVSPEDRKELGRMAAMQTKQVFNQLLRELKRRLIQEEFQDLEGTVLQGRMLRFERGSWIVGVSSGYNQTEVEAELPRKEQLPNDNYRPNSTYKMFLKQVHDGPHKGPQLVVSRADAGLVVYLFANEVPEMEDEIVRIVAVAREANPPTPKVGPRTKIAVDTLDRDVDPVGACIGSRGSRIQAVVNELRGEKIDVIRWSPDPATYIANALSPAQIESVRLMDPDGRQTHVLVNENQLSLAIGKEGQNVRLAARLTGWKIDIKDRNKYDPAAEDARIQTLITEREQQQRDDPPPPADDPEA